MAYSIIDVKKAVAHLREDLIEEVIELALDEVFDQNSEANTAQLVDMAERALFKLKLHPLQIATEAEISLDAFQEID